MSRRRIVRNALGLLVFAGLCALIWFGYGELSVLRQTMLWDLRYVVFAVGVFLLLTLAQRLWSLGVRLLPDDPKGP